jgi:hypothetical protein
MSIYINFDELMCSYEAKNDESSNNMFKLQILMHHIKC